MLCGSIMILVINEMTRCVHDRRYMFIVRQIMRVYGTVQATDVDCFRKLVFDYYQRTHTTFSD